MTLRKEPAATAALIFSVASHFAAALLALQPALAIQVPFVRELLAAIGVALAASAVGFVVLKLRSYAVAHVVRFAAFIIALRILGAADPLVELLIVVPLLIETALYLGARPATVVNALQVTVVVASDLSARWPFDTAGSVLATAATGMLATAVAGLSVLGVHFRERYVSSEQRAEHLESAVDSLSSANTAFQHYAGHVEAESATQERLRITRELHDTVGYALTSVIMSMNAALVLHNEKPAGLPELLHNTRALSEEALGETRRILHRLRAIRDPAARGLKALAQLAKAFGGATGIRVELNYGNLPMSLGAELDSAIYRLVQEGLTNAFRHGKADFVRVNLWQSETDLRVTVWDNGRGTIQEAATVGQGIGIAGMRERLAGFNATVSARNWAGGFELSAVIPGHDR